MWIVQTVLAPVFSDHGFHTLIGEKKPPRGKLRGGGYFHNRRIREFEELATVSLNFPAKSRPQNIAFRAQPHRRKLGTKHPVLVDAQGLPLSLLITKANRNDITQLMPLVDAIPSLQGRRGRPKRRPKNVLGDRGYDSQPHRRLLKKRGSSPSWRAEARRTEADWVGNGWS